MMHWWLKKGADGFRMDVVSISNHQNTKPDSQINFIAKAEGFPHAPIVLPGHETQPFGGLSINRPEVHDHLKEMYQEVISVSAAVSLLPWLNL
jgi:glycosidase